MILAFVKEGWDVILFKLLLENLFQAETMRWNDVQCIRLLLNYIEYIDRYVYGVRYNTHCILSLNPYVSNSNKIELFVQVGNKYLANRYGYWQRYSELSG